MELESELAGRFLQLSRGDLGIPGVGGIDEQGKGGRRGKDLVQQLKPFRPYLQV
jgi:hypothetical protein